jgi:predicted DNA-binding transcriptional regulator YafY
LRDTLDVAGAALPAERILHLAAFAADRCADGAEITLTDIVDGVGYPTGAERDARGQLVSGTSDWEAVRKAVQRDLRDLREHWGIRLDYDEAAHSYRLAPPFFTPDERRVLLAAVATVSVQGAPDGEPGELGVTLDDRRALVVLRLHHLVAALRTAIGDRREVTFGLYGVARRVQPYALGMWRNRWYLAGYDVDRGSLRRYRLDRVDPGEPTIGLAGAPNAYEIPDEFDVDAAFDLDPNVWGQDPVLAARVRVGIDHVDAFRSELGGEVTERDGRTAIVELEVRHHQSFRDRLLAFRGSAVVLEPPELVAVVHDHLAALAGAP